MSRRSGHVLRQAIRETWAQRLSEAIHPGDVAWGTSALRFFVGSEPDTHGGLVGRIWVPRLPYWSPELSIFNVCYFQGGSYCGQ